MVAGHVITGGPRRSLLQVDIAVYRKRIDVALEQFVRAQARPLKVSSLFGSLPRSLYTFDNIYV